MAERMFGLETEYAFAALGHGGVRIDQGRALTNFMDLARARLPYLPDRCGQGIFLQNGSRFYIDVGGHPELTTPEVLNPWDGCRYVLAGDLILGGLARELPSHDGAIERVILSRSNIGYPPPRPTTWGCHESYGHQANPASLPDELLPHLVSRIIYTGCGGFNNCSPAIEFMISPRVAHLSSAISETSTGGRGIFHKKNESLCGQGFHRLHLLCGESLCSQTALWLRMAVTAVVVVLIEAGCGPCRAIRLADPLSAMHQFSKDFGLTARVRTTDGRWLSAWEMQRCILEQIEAHAGHPLLPPWTGKVCELFRQTLDRLAQGPQAVAKTLDWAIKLSLYQELIRRRGLTLETLADWNDVLMELGTTLRRRIVDRPAWLTAESVLPGGPVADEKLRLTPLLESRGLRWEQFSQILQLRLELFALDARFSQVGEQGVFAALDRSGALEHAVPGVDNIPHAVQHPPATGRARLRGECVRRFHRQPGDYCCDWTSVWDDGHGRYLDLSDPFVSGEQWRDLHRPEVPPASSPSALRARQMLADARCAYDRGHYEQAHYFLRRLLVMENLLEQSDGLEARRIFSWVQSRRGFFDGIAVLDALTAAYGQPLWLITDYVSAYRFAGLVPAAEMVPWVQRGQQCLRQQPNDQADRVAAFREHHGACLAGQGQLEEAQRVLEEVCGPQREALRNVRILCRAMATLAEVYRRLGQRPPAQGMLDEAVAAQTAQHFDGDLADFSLTCLAKLQDDRDRARSLLQDAKRIQMGLHNHMGEARTLLLEARLGVPAEAAEAIRQRLVALQQQIPALGGCRLLAKVLGAWGRWTDGAFAPDETGDPFWGV